LKRDRRGERARIRDGRSRCGVGRAGTNDKIIGDNGMMRRIFMMTGLIAFLSFTQTAFTPAAYSPAAQETQGQAVKPGDDFQKAHASFMKKDFKASAAEIRNGAEYLRKEAESAGSEGKKMLVASVRELDKLADSVEKGAVKSDGKLKGAFSRAEHAVANNE